MPKNSLGSRLSHAWNAFMGRDPTDLYIPQNIGPASYIRPDRMAQPYFGDSRRSVVASIYNRIAIDCSQIRIEHAITDENRNYISTIRDSGLNYCLTTEANIDQTSNDFIQDIVFSMFEEGAVAVVPIDTSINPDKGSFEIYTMRTAKIVEWYPRHVKVSVYNDEDGKHYDKIVSKSSTAIIQNPFYAIMNEPNSTLKRLLRVMSHIDSINAQNASGKLDLIIQLPYSIKSKLKTEQAENRRQQIEAQLVDSKYGIAYMDATERITQLNRPLENNLWNQYKDLRELLFNQLGFTEAILNGTAGEQESINYYNSIINPILTVISKEMTRKFLTKNGRTRGQTVWYFRDPFQLIPINQIAEIGDKFTRNEILSSNEVRGLIGRSPSSDPRADQLRNSNMPDQGQGEGEVNVPIAEEDEGSSDSSNLNRERNYDVQSELKKVIEGK